MAGGDTGCLKIWLVNRGSVDGGWLVFDSRTSIFGQPFRRGLVRFPGFTGVNTLYCGKAKPRDTRP
jgi:hypothetical protein